MNFSSKVKDNIWVGAGSVVGLAVGLGTNLLRTESLFGKNFSACSNPFNGFIPFVAINNMRQKVISSTNLFNPCIPLIHTVPMLASCLSNTFYPIQSEKDTSLTERGWKNLSKLVINPLIHQNLLLGGSLLVRNLLSTPAVYPSGHVIFHAANTLNAIKSLEGLSATQSYRQKKVYTLLNIGIALTDAVWLYNSAANCQSVSEIATGVACVAISFFALEAGKAIVNKGYDLIKNRFFPITKTKAEMKPVPENETPSQDNSGLQELEKTGNDKVLTTLNPQRIEAEESGKAASTSTISKIKTISSLFKENAWVISGTLIGLTLGCTHNMIKTGSILEKDARTCTGNPFGDFHLLAEINKYRENQLDAVRNGIPMTLMNPLFPFVYLVPMFTYAIWNTAAQNFSKNSLKKFVNQGWKHLSKDVFIPCAYSILASLGGLFIREYVFNHSKNRTLDISGHVILQIAPQLFAMKALEALKENGTSWQKKTFIMLNVALGVTDGIWMYNTAANCHSVADVIGGVACSVIAFAGIESSRVIFNKGYDWSKRKLIRYLKH